MTFITIADILFCTEQYNNKICVWVMMDFKIWLRCSAVCKCTPLDHNDPSKPSHRLTNGPKPSKTIESDGSNTENH